MKKSNRIRNNLKASDRQLYKESHFESSQSRRRRGKSTAQQPGQEATPPGELSLAERVEVATERQAQKEADTKSALSKPSELTPLQKKRRERSEAIKEARRIEKENKRKND